MESAPGNWLTGVHSGRACSHEDIYTRVDRKTGACYSAKLCNPNQNWTEKQERQRTNFSAITSAISAWIKEGKETNSAEYLRVKKVFDRQSRYSTIRGMMYAKGMYYVDGGGCVTVGINAGNGGGGAAPAKRILSLSASPSAGGSVTGAGQYDDGTNATIEATANSGYSFVRWSDGDTNATRQVVMDADRSLSAMFKDDATGTEGDGSGDEGDGDVSLG